MIAFVGRALLVLLCAMTAPRPPVPDLPPVQPRPEPLPPALDPSLCHQCQKLPRRGGSWFCGDACQRVWQAIENRIVPLEATPPTLPDGSPYRRTP